MRRAGAFAVDLEREVVDEAVIPVFTGLERLDNRVVGRVEVFGCVFILRIVTTANMPTFETEAQVYPRIPDSQTILTAICARCNLSYLV